jgi:hypothetical protein
MALFGAIGCFLLLWIWDRLDWYKRTGDMWSYKTLWTVLIAIGLLIWVLGSSSY